jgi:hypothetical protein
MSTVAMAAMVATATTAAMLAAAVTLALQAWVAPAPTALGVVDVAALYRAQEQAIAAALLKRDLTPAQREALLKSAAGFGEAVSKVLVRLPGQCRCLVLHRAAILGSGVSGATLTDLTPMALSELELKP